VLKDISFSECSRPGIETGNNVDSEEIVLLNACEVVKPEGYPVFYVSCKRNGHAKTKLGLQGWVL